MDSNKKILVNPFNISEPVKDPEKLFGRETEIEEIEKYFQEGSLGQITHLAIIGERAAGKTSLLNILEIRAKEYKLIPVKIDLNEGLASSARNLFFEFYNSLIDAIVREDILGGEKGKFYSAYTDMMYSYTIPEGEEFRFLRFPEQVARARGREFQVSQNVVENDLRRLMTEVKDSGFKGVAIFFDEFDCLTQSRTLLEMLRNIFQRLYGYILIVAGSPMMFSEIDSVYSPLPRQYIRITLTGYEKYGQTAILIFRSLRELDVKLPDIETVIDIHELTEGKPYEIQLICKQIFELITRKEKKFSLTSEVLERVAMEIKRGQTKERIYGIRKIVNLRKDDLTELRDILRFKNLSLTDMATKNVLKKALGNPTQKIEYIEKAIKKEESKIRKMLEKYSETGIVTIENGIPKIVGADEFLLLYIKYAAKAKGIDWRWNDNTIDSTLIWMVVKDLAKAIDGIMWGRVRDLPKRKDTIKQLLRENYKYTYREVILFDIHEITERCKGSNNIYYLIMSVRKGAEKEPIIIHTKEIPKDLKGLKSSVENYLTEKRNITGYAGIEIELTEVGSEPVIKEEIISKALHHYRTGFTRKAIEEYEKGQYDKAISNFREYLILCPSTEDAGIINNIGYLYMVGKKDFPKSKRYFLDSIERQEMLLNICNLGTNLLLLGQPEEAREQYTKCIEFKIKKKEEDESYVMAVPHYVEGKIEIIEIKNFPIKATAHIGLSILEKENRKNCEKIFLECEQSYPKITKEKQYNLIKNSILKNI